MRGAAQRAARKHAFRVVLVLVLSSEPLWFSAFSTSAQVIAGGAFSIVAGDGSSPDFRNVARWQGTGNVSTAPPEWLKTMSTNSGVMFLPSDRVNALVFDPSKRWLIIGGEFQDPNSPHSGSLIRAEMPGPSEFTVLYHFYKQSDNPSATGSLFALEYWANSHPVGWELYVGGDFTGIHHLRREHVRTVARYVARCVYSTDESFTCFSLPSDAIAPDSPVYMLAFENVSQTLYAGGKMGPIRAYHVPSETWSLLKSSVALGSTVRILDLLFDQITGNGFVAFADASGPNLTDAPETLQYGRNGVLFLSRRLAHEEFIVNLSLPSQHVASLTFGTDSVIGRRGVFAAGNDSQCPALWFLPLGDPSGWKRRNLKACLQPSSALGEEIVQSLLYIEFDKVLLMAGDFNSVSDTLSTNIAISRDAGRSWMPLKNPMGEKEGVEKNPNAAGPTVSALVAIPQVDVTHVEPAHVSPLGGARVTMHGSGFKSLPASLVARVGGTECLISEWVSDVMLTCQVASGFGDALKAGAAFGGAFQRSTFLFSYTAPIIGNNGQGIGMLTDPSSASLGGNQYITVFGENFGNNWLNWPARVVEVRVGETLCDDGSWTSDTSLRCYLRPGGLGSGERKTTNLSLTATVGRRIAGASIMRFSYLPPSVTALNPSGFPTTGMPAAFVTLLGKSFGSRCTGCAAGNRDVTRRVQLGLGTVLCDHINGWTSDTSIRCPAPGKGVGFIPMTVTVVSQTCTQGCSQEATSASLLRYYQPQIKSFSVRSSKTQEFFCPDRNCLPVEGSGILDIRGTGFGPDDGVGPVHIAIGISKCDNVVFRSDDLLSCLTPAGAGDQLKLTVEVGGQFGTAADLLRYMDPVLVRFSLTPRLLPRDGGAVVTVRGNYFLKDPSAYAAVWRPRDYASNDERESLILSIRDLPESSRQGNSRQEVLINVVGMPLRGAALLFARVRASAAQKSNELETECEEALGTSTACIYFTERSPLITVSIAASMPYDVTKWKAQFSKYLNLPTSDLLYILGVTSNAGGLRRFHAREKAAWREQEEPQGTDRHASTNTGSLSHVGPLRKERQGETTSKRDGTEGEELERGLVGEALERDLVREASKRERVGEEVERDRVRQATGTVSIQLYILSDLADPWSYQTAVTFLKSRLDSREGRQELGGALGVTLITVGAETVKTEQGGGASIPLVEVLPVQLLLMYLSSSQYQSGEACVGNASFTSYSSQSAQTHSELVCPGGGSCVKSGVMGAGISASWIYGAILGVFLVAGMSAITVGMKMSADHRRKKRAMENLQKRQAKNPLPLPLPPVKAAAADDREREKEGAGAMNPKSKFEFEEVETCDTKRRECEHPMRTLAF